MTKGNQRNSSDKSETVNRYYRGAARFEERKKNVARSNRSGGRGLREDLEDGFEEEDKAPARTRRTGRSGSTPAAHETSVATVLSVARTHVGLLLEQETVLAPISGSVRGLALAVGDRIEVEVRAQGPPRLIALRERKSALTRPDPGNRHRELVIAANVDVGVIVVAAKDPPLRPALIDRYLIALEYGGVQPAVCVNKLDLITTEAERAKLDEALAPYQQLEVPILFASVASHNGIDELRAALADKTSVLVGHSGVGKSSLLNALSGTSSAEEGTVRGFDGKGKHTTTSSSLHLLPAGVRVIDTPGVRAFGLAGVTQADLRDLFPGLSPFASRCRFPDCVHVQEPDCAVRAASEAGVFPSARYGVYLRLFESLLDEGPS